MSSNSRDDIRSDEVNDILSRPPSWMVSSGGVVVLVLILILLLISSIFKYPDIIKAPITITSENLPAQLVARRSGRIQTILKENGVAVNKGDVIAIIENPGSFADYLKVKVLSESYLSSDTLPEKLQLGEFQDSYSQFIKSLKEYNAFFSLDYHRKMINSVKREIEIKRNRLLITERKEKVALELYSIARDLFNREKLLFEQKNISQQDFDKARSSLLSVEKQFEDAGDELIKIKAEIVKDEKSLLDLESDKIESQNRLKRALDADYAVLNSRIAEWEQLYLFISPVDGIVSFTSYWQENQNVSVGDVVFTVLPSKESKISGKLYIPLTGAGKVKVGQRVNIKLDSYPYLEYGMVEVCVKSISRLPASANNGRFYIVDVDLPKGLVTNYSKELIFTEEMHGTGEIVTENLSVLRRVLNPVKHLLKNNF